MEFAEATEFTAVPPEFGASRGMFPRSRRCRTDVEAGRETFGSALQFEQPYGAVVFFRKERGHQMRTLVRFAAFALMDLIAGFEDTETIEVLGVFHDVAVDARQQ